MTLRGRCKVMYLLRLILISVWEHSEVCFFTMMSVVLMCGNLAVLLLFAAGRHWAANSHPHTILPLYTQTHTHTQLFDMQALTHLQVVEGPLLQLTLHGHKGFVVASSPGGRVHLPGLTHCHGWPGASFQGVAVVPVVSPSIIPSQSYCGTGHTLPRPLPRPRPRPWPLPTATFLGPLHGELLDGCVKALVSAGIPPSAPADQEAAVTVQVVVRAPPACCPAAMASARLVSWVSALAALSGLAPPGGARLVTWVVASTVLPSTPVASSSLTTVVSAPSRPIVLTFGWRLQGMGLGKETLHGVHQVADTWGALAALLGAPAGGALVLQCVEAIRMKGHLLLKLVDQIWGNAVHLPSVARQALLARVKRLERRVLAGVRAGEGPPSGVAMGVRVWVGMMPLKRQGLSWTRRVIVAIAVTLVVISARAITVLRRAVAGGSSATTGGGMLGHATADMVPFHRRRGVVGRPGRKGALRAWQGCTGLTCRHKKNHHSGLDSREHTVFTDNVSNNWI